MRGGGGRGGGWGVAVVLLDPSCIVTADNKM